MTIRVLFVLGALMCSACAAQKRDLVVAGFNCERVEISLSFDDKEVHSP